MDPCMRLTMLSPCKDWRGHQWHGNFSRMQVLVFIFFWNDFTDILETFRDTLIAWYSTVKQKLSWWCKKCSLGLSPWLWCISVRCEFLMWHRCPTLRYSPYRIRSTQIPFPELFTHVDRCCIFVSFLKDKVRFLRSLIFPVGFHSFWILAVVSLLVLCMSVNVWTQTFTDLCICLPLLCFKL